MERNTIQRKIVLEAVRQLGNHPSSEEVFAFINQSHPTISRSTVYRNINLLCEQGKLLKIKVPGYADHADHSLHNHRHMFCNRCKKVFDIEIETPDLLSMIKDSNGCYINECSIMFFGLCPDCISG